MTFYYWLCMMCVDLCMWIQVPLDPRRGIRSPRTGVNQWVWAACHGCWAISAASSTPHFCWQFIQSRKIIGGRKKKSKYYIKESSCFCERLQSPVLVSLGLGLEHVMERGWPDSCAALSLLVGSWCARMWWPGELIFLKLTGFYSTTLPAMPGTRDIVPLSRDWAEGDRNLEG